MLEDDLNLTTRNLSASDFGGRVSVAQRSSADSVADVYLDTFSSVEECVNIISIGVVQCVLRSLDQYG